MVMDWIEWGKWGVLLVLVGSVITYTLAMTKGEALRRWDSILKYGTFVIAMGIFISFLERFTGLASEIDIIFMVVGAAPAYIAVMRFFRLLPEQFCNWLEQVPRGK